MVPPAPLQPEPEIPSLDLTHEVPGSDLQVWGEPVQVVPPDHHHDDVLDLAADPRETPTADLPLEEIEINVAVGGAQADVNVKARDIFRSWLLNVAVSWFIMTLGVGLLARMVPEQSDLIFAGWVGFSLMIITLGWLDLRDPGRS